MSSTGATYNWRQLGDPFRRTGAIAETVGRASGAALINLNTLALGTLFVCGIDLPQGTTVTSTTWMSGPTTAFVVGTTPSLWAVLADSSRVVKAVTVNDAAATWATSAEHVFTFSTPFVTTYSGLHYIGIQQNGTTATAPSLLGTNPNISALALAPIVCGTSNVFGSPAASQTPPALASTLTAITAQATLVYAYVS